MLIDAIVENARIRTLDPARPTATRLGTLHGRVVGLDEDLDGVRARQVHDLGGATVLPGFHDAHQHLSKRGQRARWLDLHHPGVPDLEALYRAVAERAATLPRDAWVFGGGYDQNKIGGHPTADALDRVAGGRPVWVEHVSGHMGVANTAAFARAGHPGRQGVPDVEGGAVARADGLPTGLLQETAQRLVRTAFRPFPVEEVVADIAAGSRMALAEGTTSVTEPGVGAIDHIGSSHLDLHAFQLAADRGLLGVRMTVMPYLTLLHPVGAGMPDQDWYGLDVGIRTGLGNDRLRLGPAKVLSDGSLIGRSAAMRCCYAGEPDNAGFLQWDPQALTEVLVAAHASGWQLAAHAIGDAAIDVALDAFELAQRRHPRPDVRHRIEHFAVADDQQVARAAALGIVPVPQGRFVSELGDGMLAALGPERARTCYRMRSLLDAGMVLPGSSDAPVAHGAPLLGIHDMVNRRTGSGAPFGPDERLTPAQAVEAYTRGSAYAVHQERDKGTLRAGMLADLVVLSADPLAVPEDEIAGIEVRATFVGGELAHEAAPGRAGKPHSGPLRP
ncbi:amidohydrolase [Pseudonocardia zijingensis]|uniref:Amidohydrolase n=1 Tax=Pseudonocardia zijingensis TaxID=153376 RepID=A0ABN1P4Y4_9PSEU